MHVSSKWLDHWLMSISSSDGYLLSTRYGLNCRWWKPVTFNLSPLLWQATLNSSCHPHPYTESRSTPRILLSSVLKAYYCASYTSVKCKETQILPSRKGRRMQSYSINYDAMNTWDNKGRERSSTKQKEWIVWVCLVKSGLHRGEGNIWALKSNANMTGSHVASTYSVPGASHTSHICIIA